MEKKQAQFQQDQVQTVSIPREHEFRFEVDFGQKVVLRLQSGTAEILGCELAPQVDYTFYGGTKLGVFSWHGCELQVIGACKVEYTASETPMISYLNTHIALENKRMENTSRGDGSAARVVLVGSADVGKTTLARILLAYALKCGRRPMFVDLDPGEGTLAVPTSIGAVVMDRMDVEETTGISLTSTPPLLYSFGHLSPQENLGAYQHIVSQLARICLKRMEKETEVQHSGMIIDTHAWNDRTGVQELAHIVDAFHADIVLVVGNERIYSEVTKAFSDQGRTTAIVKLSKSGGVVERDKTYRRQMQMMRIREYFYGTPKFELTPYTSSIPFHEIQVRRIGEANLSAVPDSALPLGAERKEPELKLIRMESFTALLNSILAVSNADLDPSDAGATSGGPKSPSEEAQEDEILLTSNIAGFVYVSAVDEKKKRLHFLTPNPGRLPKKYLWLGALRWSEVS